MPMDALLYQPTTVDSGHLPERLDPAAKLRDNVADHVSIGLTDMAVAIDGLTHDQMHIDSAEMRHAASSSEWVLASEA